MSYLLDTNIVSETIRRNPNKTLISWLDQIPGEALFVSVLTLGEIRKGVETLADKKRREKLRLWLEHELPIDNFYEVPNTPTKKHSGFR